MLSFTGINLCCTHTHTTATASVILSLTSEDWGARLRT